MTQPEDTGSNTPEDARRYEEWRARHYDDHDEGGPRRTRGRSLKARGCRCHSASEEPCDYCSAPPEREEESA